VNSLLFAEIDLKKDEFRRNVYPLRKRRFLYLAPFLNKKYFKLGISVNLNSRLKTHDRIYNLDYNKILVVEANKNKTISLIEQELKLIFPKANVGKVNGYTEIIEMKYFNEVIEVINLKHKNLNIKIRKYTEHPHSVNLDLLCSSLTINNNKINNDEYYKNLNNDEFYKNLNMYMEKYKDIL